MRNLLKYASSATRQILHHRRCSSGPRVSFYARPFYSSGPRVAFNVRPFCSSKGGDSSNGDNNGDGETSSELAEVEEDLKKLSSALVEDVETVEILKELRKYYGDKEDNLEAVAELVMKRAFSRKHDQSDEELMDELQMDVVEDVHDSEFESDFEEAYETDHEVENLYNATEYTEEKLLDDGHVEMDAETYDEVVKEMQEKGHVIDQQSLEELVEDMTNWDKLLPEDLKQKIEAKFNELGNMCERGELEPEEAYALFKEFEEAVAEEYAQKLPSEEIPQDIEREKKGWYL
jgi:small subunit ribosomal protein S35